MKLIAVDARPLVPPLKGIGRYASQLLLALIKLEPNFHWLLYTVSEIPQEWANFDNVTVRKVPHSCGRFSSLFSQSFFYFWLLRDRPSIFWSPRHHLPLMRVSNVKYYLTIHDLVWLKKPQTMTRQRWLLERILMPRSLAVADHVFYVSRSTRRDVEENFGYFPSSIVYPSSVFKNCPPVKSIQEKNKYFLFVGTWEPRKNLPRLILAFKSVVNVDKSIQLKVVGQPGWGREDLDELVKSLDLEDFVSFIVAPDDSTLSNLYSCAHALLMPSLYEGFGLPLIEAMSFGLPTVTSNLSSMPEVVGDAGLLVDPDDTASISEAILKLVQDEGLYRHLSYKAQQRSREFSLNNSAEVLLDEFNRV